MVVVIVGYCKFGSFVCVMRLGCIRWSDSWIKLGLGFVDSCDRDGFCCFCDIRIKV